ncbi:MAG: DNA alkylation repair protein [Desulfovibrio sp.]|nr:DNA alkylation repair protein [Desulfovibrio sp.]
MTPWLTYSMTALEAAMSDTTTMLRLLRADLRAKADPSHREGSRAFFKETIRPLGVRARDLNPIISRHWRAARALPPEELMAACDRLWASGVFEEASVACKWCARALPVLGLAAFPVFERWLSTRVDNWAHCDDLATHCVGGLLALHPESVEGTVPWLSSPNRWLRRAAAVSVILPARYGLYLHHVFRVADLLLVDNDDLVRKGYGWLLKEASKAWPREVLEFILPRRGQMPRVALRYAIELMPQDWRRQAMSPMSADK